MIAYVTGHSFLICKGWVCQLKRRSGFESYLTDRMQSTRLGTSRSEELIVTHGVPQGSILRSLIFSLYMNDLPSVVKFSSVDSHVDVTKVYLSFSSKDIDSCLTKVTEDLCAIAAWCCTNKLLIDPTKTKLILFGIRELLSKIPDVRVPFLSQNLAPVSGIKDLGIILDSNDLVPHLYSVSDKQSWASIFQIRTLHHFELLGFG